MANKEIVITMKTYVDGKLVSESAKVIMPPPWIIWWVVVTLVPVGLWILSVQGGFR